MTDRSRHHADDALRRLAHLLGVQTTYVDAAGQKRNATPDTLSAVIDALGYPCLSEPQVDSTIDHLIEFEQARGLEPVIPVWQGSPASALLRCSAIEDSSGSIDCTIRLEDGSEQSWKVRLDELDRSKAGPPAGLDHQCAIVPLPRDLPAGYHELMLRAGQREFSSMLISAPLRCFEGEAGHHWGLFCPVYALRPKDPSRDLGCGDLTDLQHLAQWASSLGSRVVATLPMLALHLDEPFDPSPYAPVSRLFWNELFIDPARAPEMARCPEASEIMSSPAFRDDLARLRADPQRIDYRAASSLHRRVLDALARTFWSDRSAALGALEPLIDECSRVEDYATYRAISEKQRAGWPRWPDQLREGRIGLADYEPDAQRYHIYVQHLMRDQLREVERSIHEHEGLVYLDLPIGTSAGGYDVWSNQDLFALSCATGAPPDPYFMSGQNWGFAPLHPHRLRESRYAHLIDVLRHHMRYADILRLDHVMAFHRLYWIPRGGRADEGAYVRYGGEEIYAILSLESHRQQCRLVGENLGTVPPEVNQAIERHGLAGLFVAQYEMNPDPSHPLRTPPPRCVASINTHDMAPFAKHWAGGDIDDRISLNMLDTGERERELELRHRTRAALVSFLRTRGLLEGSDQEPDPILVRDALTRFLAGSEASDVLINIEDLWMETDWQNVPGTVGVYPNWQRRLRFDLAELERDPAVRALLEWIARLRTGEDAPAPDVGLPAAQTTGDHGASL